MSKRPIARPQVTKGQASTPAKPSNAPAGCSLRNSGALLRRPNAGIRKKPPGRKTFTDGNMQVYKSARQYYQTPAARRWRTARAVLQLSKLRKLGSRSREQRTRAIEGPWCVAKFPAGVQKAHRTPSSDGRAGKYPSQALKRTRGLFPAEFRCPAAKTKRRRQKKAARKENLHRRQYAGLQAARLYYQSPATRQMRTARAVLIFPALHLCLSKRANANWRELHVRIAGID